MVSAILAVVVAAALFAYLRHVGCGSKRPAWHSATDVVAGDIKGPGEFRFHIVGESNYQQALAAIAGPRDENGKEHRCKALLMHDDGNAYDDEAVRIEIDGQTVGHLDRKAARGYRTEVESKGAARLTLRADALIVGGWDRGHGDRGHYGVKLDLPLSD